MSIARFAIRRVRAFAFLCALFATLGAHALPRDADFNGDGKADVLWYNETTGQTSTWLMNGTAGTAAAVLLADPNWKVIGTADFNGDGQTDLLWYNAVTGQTSIWLMSGTSMVAAAVILSDPNWKVIGTGDLNGDGKADLLWYNAATGQTGAWLMNGMSPLSTALLLTDPAWKIALVLDLNGDGKADLLWYNAATGQTGVWIMNGLSAPATALLLTDPNWKVIGTGDLNGDGKADLVWYNAATGQTGVWLMNGTSAPATALLLTDANWKVIGTADFNGDGRADLLWYNAATGQTAIWLMNGTSSVGTALLLTDPNWRVVGTPDFNGDGKADLLWFNSLTGDTSTWLMNGTAQSSAGTLLSDAAWSARVISALPANSPALPLITSQPAGAGVIASQTATFAVSTTANPAAGYQWQVSTNSGTTFSDIPAANARTYTTQATVVADNGKVFRVKVTNSLGSAVSANAVLSVVASGVAPTVTAQPSDQFVFTPFTGTLTTSASGSPSPTYQWQLSRDGGTTFANVAGATARTFTTAPTTAADEEHQLLYRAFISNAAGSVVTHPALLAIVNSGMGGEIYGFTFDGAGNLYASVSLSSSDALDSRAAFYGVKRLDKVTGAVSTVAGSSAQGYVNGSATTATFWHTEGIAADAAGNLYVVDWGVNQVRKISTSGSVTTFAGGDINGGFVNGVGTQATFHGPHGIAIDGVGNLYVTDGINGAVRKITPAGAVSTFATGFSVPWGITIDSAGNLVVTDTTTVRRVSPLGIVTTIANAGTPGFIAAGSSTYSLYGIASDAAGNAYVGVQDSGGYAIRVIAPNGTVSTVSGSTTIRAQPFGVFVDASGNIFTTNEVGGLKYYAANPAYFPNKPYSIRRIAPSGETADFP